MSNFTYVSEKTSTSCLLTIKFSMDFMDEGMVQKMCGILCYIKFNPRHFRTILQVFRKKLQVVKTKAKLGITKISTSLK
jgi:hypothetical protein